MILSMAWRNIWRNKLRSLIIILSISIGLFAGIAVAALYHGMIKSRVHLVINSEVGHIQLHDTDFKKNYEAKYILQEHDELVKTISQLSQVKTMIPRSITTGMLSSVTGSAGVQINGIHPYLEYTGSSLSKKLVEGRLFDTIKHNEILIGRKLANKFKLKPGSKTVLTFTDSSGTIVSGAFRIAGIYQTENAPMDERNVYVPIWDLNTLLVIGNAFHEIAVILKNDNDVEIVQKILQKKYPQLKVESWQEISPETDLMVNTVNQYTLIIMVIIMMALSFGIINTMLMAVLERTREIGMMLALGTIRIKIFFLILFETIFLTLAGTPIGILIGWLVSNYFNNHGLDFSRMGSEMMNSFGFSTMIYPEFPQDKLPMILLIVITTSVLSSLLPAIKALKLQPVEALSR